PARLRVVGAVHLVPEPRGPHVVEVDRRAHQNGDSPSRGSCACGGSGRRPDCEWSERSIFCTCAVAHRSDGATSSATISILLRFSPPPVSQLRGSSPPVATTRVPYTMPSAPCSARSAHAFTSKKLTCSSHSW